MTCCYNIGMVLYCRYFLFHVSVHKSRCEYIGSQVLSCLLFVMSLYPSSIHRKYFSWLYRISSEFLKHCPKLILSLVISIYIIKWCIYESCIRFCIRILYTILHTILYTTLYTTLYTSFIRFYIRIFNTYTLDSFQFTFESLVSRPQCDFPYW